MGDPAMAKPPATEKTEGGEDLKSKEPVKDANVDQQILQKGASDLALQKKTSAEEGYAKDQAHTLSPTGVGRYKELLAQLREAGEGQTAKQVTLEKSEDTQASKPEDKPADSKDAKDGKPEEKTESTGAKGKIEIGATVVTDGDGHLTSVTYPDGLSATIAPGPDGKPQEIDYSNDTKLVRNADDGSW